MDRSREDVAESTTSIASPRAAGGGRRVAGRRRPRLLVRGLRRGPAEVELVAAGARHLLHARLLALVARVAGRAAIVARQLGRRVQHGHEAAVGRGRRAVGRRLAVGRGEGRRRGPVGGRRGGVGVGPRVLQEGDGLRRRGRRGAALRRRRRAGRGRRRRRPAVGRRARRRQPVRTGPSSDTVQLLQRAVVMCGGDFA